jgi:hypothetical protein
VCTNLAALSDAHAPTAACFLHGIEELILLAYRNCIFFFFFFFLALEDTVSVLPVESLRRQLGKGKSLSSMIVSNG